MPNKTQEEFLKDLNPDTKTDVFSEPLTPTVEQTTTEPVVTEEDKSNRRERRLQSKLQAERESAIALAAKLEVLTEAQQARTTSESDDYLKSVERIYGTDTPENTAATELLKNAFTNFEKRATKTALDQFRAEQKQERDAVTKEEQSLDSMVEEIEDETGTTLDAQTKQGFFQLLEKLSPKDKDDNIIAYADHNAVWDELQARKQQAQPNRAKDLAARSMVNAGAPASTTVEATANERFLMQNGLI